MYDSEETLQLAQESRLKMKQLNKEIKLANYAKINQLSVVFVSQKAKSHEELYFSNTSKTASVSKSVFKTISIPNEEFSDDTSLSVARKFLNEDIMSIVQSNSIVDTSNIQTELDLCKYDKNLYDKAYKDMHQKIKRLQAQLGDLKGKNKDTLCISDTLAPLSQKLEDENVIPKVGESNALLKPVNSNSSPSTRESKVVKNDNVIASGIFRINPSNTSKGPSASKSSCIKNKDVEVEEHHRNLLLSKNQKHMSSECNNIKLVIRNDKSEVVCAMCDSNLFTVRRLGMLKAYDRKSEAS
ncbi:hypothetical protein Tco_0889159 [Tanacetum coccineum]